MRLLLSLVLAFLLAATPPSAQDLAAYQKSFNDGVAALNAGRLDEGIALFRKCLEILPEDPISAYNLACGHAKKGEADNAFQWLDQAASWGFGNLDDANGGSNLAFCRADTDLAGLREDPRWAKVLERMQVLRKPFDDFRGSAAVYVPKALEGASEFPLLVVLHDDGKSKTSVVEGPWKRLADELGCALVAPSGRVPMKPLELAAGMRWNDSLAGYARSYRTDERPVTNAVNEFQKTHKLAAGRVYVAGEGQGAMLAFNIAVSKPSLYAGVLVVNGVIHAELAAPRVAAAAKAGLRVHLLLDARVLRARVQGRDPQALIDGMTRTLGGWPLAAEVETFETVEGEPDSTEARALAALESFAAPAPGAGAPAEAGTGK